MQLGRTFIQIATVIGAITVVLCVADGELFFRNQSLQVEVDQRQKFINDSLTLSRLHEGLTRALATSAYTHSDDQLRQMLHEQGIDYTVNNTGDQAAGAAPASAPAAAPAPAMPAKK